MDGMDARGVCCFVCASRDQVRLSKICHSRKPPCALFTYKVPEWRLSPVERTLKRRDTFQKQLREFGNSCKTVVN